RKAFHDMVAQAGIDFDHSPVGILHVYETAKSMAHADRVNDLLAKGGLHRRAVTPAEIQEIEPTLHGDFVGGYYTDSDSTGDIHKYATGLADYLKRVGVQFRMGYAVEAVHHMSNGVQIDTVGGTLNADALVVTAGVGSRDLARQLGDRVNVYPVKGYSITVNMRDEVSQAAAPQVSLLDDEAKIVTSRLGADRFRVAGTAEFNGENRDIRNDRIVPLVKWVEKFFPDVSTEHVTPWAGLRPMMPNMMPRVGQGLSDRVFYNTGHGHLGWTLSAATAEIIGAKIADRFGAT
ncbi:MAG: FAD-dependent oxidoreductase, partial [Planktomarina sp.]